MYQIDALVQERRNSIALVTELRLSCTKPSNYGGNKNNEQRIYIDACLSMFLNQTKSLLTTLGTQTWILTLTLQQLMIWTT